MDAFEWIGRIVIGLGVGVLALFLLVGAAGAIAAAMLSARIDHDQEQAKLEGSEEDDLQPQIQNPAR